MSSADITHDAVLGQFGQCQRLVEMFGSPSKQSFGEPQPHGLMGRISGEAVQFARVLVQVEEQRRQAATEMHIFEFFRADDGEVALT